MQKKKKMKIHLLKRFFDLFAALSALLVLSPLFLLIAFLLKLEGLFRPSLRGPVFFRETRISRGREFFLYKFRTVKSDILKVLKDEKRSITEFTAVHDKHRYLTPVGVFLAQTYLDELPQLINVIKGNISMVGPRPHIPEHYKNDLKSGIVSAKYIRGGMMGLMQASKGNAAMKDALARMVTKHSTKDKTVIFIDRLYFQKYLRSSEIEMLLYDLWIIYRCMIVVFEAKGI